MSRKISLRELCHSRSGNKGDDVNVGIAVYDPSHYQWMKDQLSEDRVEEHFKGLTSGPVRRFELPRLGALNFLIPGVLSGGHSGTLVLDTLGKSFSSSLLSMEINPPDSDAEFSAQRSKVGRAPIDGGNR